MLFIYAYIKEFKLKINLQAEPYRIKCLLMWGLRLARIFKALLHIGNREIVGTILVTVIITCCYDDK